MAGYQIFQQPTGPQIDVNLFPQSSLAGAQASKYIPDPIAAGVEGFTQGIKTGQDLYEGFQQIDLNKERISQEQARTRIIQNQASPENIGILNENAKAELESRKQRNAAAALELDYNKKNEQLINDTRSQTYRAQQTKAIEQGNEAQATNEVNSMLSNTDAYNDQQLFDALNSPKYSQVFAKNQSWQLGLYDSLLSRQSVRDNAQLTQQIEDAREDAMLRGTQRNNYLRDNIKWNNDVTTAIHDDKVIGRIDPGKYGMTPQEFLQKAMVSKEGDHPKTGDYYDMEGTQIKTNKIEASENRTDRRTEVAIPVGGRWRVVGSFADDELDKFTRGRIAAKNLSDPYGNNLVRTRRAERAAARSQQQTDTFNRANVTSNVLDGVSNNNVSVFKNSVQRTLGLDDKTFNELTPAFKSIQQLADKYSYDPQFRAKSTYEALPQAELTSIVDTVAKREFDASPSLQAAYRKKAEFRDAELSRTSTGAMNMWATLRHAQGMEPLAPKSPYELYKLDRQVQIFSQLDSAISQYHQHQATNRAVAANTQSLRNMALQEIQP